MKHKKDNGRLYGWIIVLFVILCVTGFAGFMLLNACCLHLMRATVFVEDLPPAFEGTTVLYASDIDLGGLNTPRRAAEAFNRLRVLQPDLLLLGGDYTAPTVLDLLNQSVAARYRSNLSNAREDFFYYISDFPATLGRYMIAAPDDRLAGNIDRLAQDSGFGLLNGRAVEIVKGADRLWLVGLEGNASRLSSRFNRGDCVVALACSPNQFPSTMTTEAADSGHWVDLALAGHTHGGQIIVAGRSILSLDALERQYLYGWNRETGVPMLVTSGMGCEGINLRLNSQSEVWLITLTAQGAP